MNVILQEAFCRNVKAAMRIRGVSQSELARKMNVGRAVVNQYLVGRRSPGLDVIENFANALDLVPSWLIDEQAIEDRLEVHA